MDAVYNFLIFARLEIEHVLLVIWKLESYFKQYQIMLIDETYKLTNCQTNRQMCTITLQNHNDKFNNFIYLIHVGDHFNVIDSMSSYLFKSYYWDLCKKGFDHTEEHNCIIIGKACNRMNCRQDFKVKCRNCELFTQNKSCFDPHEESNCQVAKKCPECLYYISKRRAHVCGEDKKWCTDCNESVYLLHKCYIRT